MKNSGIRDSIAFIPATVHCEGTVEAISMGFEHSTSSFMHAVNFTLNRARALDSYS